MKEAGGRTISECCITAIKEFGTCGKEKSVFQKQLRIEYPQILSEWRDLKELSQHK